MRRATRRDVSGVGGGVSVGVGAGVGAGVGVLHDVFGGAVVFFYLTMTLAHKLCVK